MAGPAIHLSVEGDGLVALQRKLKDCDKILTRELNKALREIGGELIPDARAAARSGLPRHGGLNERIAGAKMRVAISASKREPGVKIVVKGTDARSSNKGLIRHPVFGKWLPNLPPQKIRPGWFTDAMKQKAPRVRPKLAAALERTAEKIAGA